MRHSKDPIAKAILTESGKSPASIVESDKQWEDMKNYRIIKISVVQWSQNNLCGQATGKLRHISGRYPL